MGYKMKGAPMIANTKSHGTNKNYTMSGMTNADGTASGAPFIKGLGKMAGNFVKGKGAMGFLNPIGAIANKAGLFDKRPEGNNVMGQEPAPAQAEQPNPNTVAQDPSVQEQPGPPNYKKGYYGE